jgi:pyrroloquinoline quinone biosynthesis protein B
MIIKVLGSAAGGGFPQINCRCRNCADARAGAAWLAPRTQSSLAVSVDGERWMLLNASPDLRQQLAATPELAPRVEAGARSSPLAAVVLTNGDIDHVAGLLSLREGIPFELHASARVLDILAANSIFNVLDARIVQRVAVPLGHMFETCCGLTLEAYPVPGKVALYLERPEPGFGTREDDTVGLAVGDPTTGAIFHYVPGCAAVDARLAARLEGAALVFFDGTLYTDDELIAQGLSDKSGRRMGHISISGARGSLAAFEPLGVERRIYVHMNNSNPILREGSPERVHVEGAGWEVAWDGMEVRL